MNEYIEKLKVLTTNFSYNEFILLLKQIDNEIINGSIKQFSSEFIQYFNQIISMVNNNYIIDNNELVTLGHMLVENALLEKKKLTPTLAMCFYLEQKSNLGFNDIFNDIGFYEQDNCSMFIDDENNIFNINLKACDKLSNNSDEYNYNMMEHILHEITHIYQTTRTEETDDIFDKLVYYDYQQLKNLQQSMDYGQDLLIHNSYISEFMADENALVFMLTIARRHPEYFNEELIQTKLAYYQERKNSGAGSVGADPRMAEEKMIQLSKDMLEEIKSNYEEYIKFNGIEHITWLINTNEKMLANFEEINRKRNPLIAQLEMQGVSEKGYDSYYNIFLKSFYQFDGKNIVLNEETQEKGFSY